MPRRELSHRCIDCSCRTHRERKEQYIRNLETDVSRLREAYASEITAANASLQQHKQMVQNLTDENDVLKEMLSAHGIPFEAEVGRGKAERAAARSQHSPFTSSPTSQTQSAGPQSYNTITPPTSVSNNISPPPNGSASFGISPTQQYFSEPQACPAPQGESVGMLDRSGPAYDGPVQAMPTGGVFEADPQLQIDFILTCVSLLQPGSSVGLTLYTDWKGLVASTQTSSADAPSRKQRTKTCRSPATR